MGLISSLLGIIFGNDRNVLKETAEVFRTNAEEESARGQELRIEALGQFGREFENKSDGPFNRFMDGVNRLPRPALAVGTLGLFVSAMVDPIWFAARMQGIALVPEPLWWLLGVIVSFYFGARHQVKSQQFQRSIAQTVALAPQAARNIQALHRLTDQSPAIASTGSDASLRSASLEPAANRALEDWRLVAGDPATK